MSLLVSLSVIQSKIEWVGGWGGFQCTFNMSPNPPIREYTISPYRNEWLTELRTLDFVRWTRRYVIPVWMRQQWRHPDLKCRQTQIGLDAELVASIHSADPKKRWVLGAKAAVWLIWCRSKRRVRFRAGNASDRGCSECTPSKHINGSGFYLRTLENKHKESHTDVRLGIHGTMRNSMTSHDIL